MSFDYFNNSMLAFGIKLTRAFASLEKLQKEAEANVTQVIFNQSIFNEFIDKNYQIPRPSRPDSPVRPDEIFDILNDKEVYLRTLEWKDGKLNIEGLIFKRSNNRITRFSGSTNKKSGFVYYVPSISNLNPSKELQFEDEALLVDSNLLFEYRIDSNNNINIIGDVSNMNLVPFDTTQYKSLSKGDTLAGENEKYKAKDYEVVCIVGSTNQTIVNLNSEWIFGNKTKMGYGNTRHCILYLKPDDVITGTYKKIFRINYNS